MMLVRDRDAGFLDSGSAGWSRFSSMSRVRPEEFRDKQRETMQESRSAEKFACWDDRPNMIKL